MGSRPRRIDGYAPIRDYGAIGDEQSLALVALDGAIDWWCVPGFASPPVCLALLDARRGGRIEVAPDEPYEVERRYLPDTNVLETTFTTAGGTVRVTDALTLPSQSLSWNELVRRVECLAGSMELRWRVAPRFGWEVSRGEVERRHGVPVVRHRGLALAVLAHGLGDAKAGGGDVEGRASLRDGEGGVLAVCAFEDAPLLLSGRDALEARLRETAERWRDWASGGLYDGPWRDAVVRSALALQLLVDRSTGAMVAAGTTSLPERIGGSKNWDYRFTWLRDTSFALEALLRLGKRQQVQATLEFVLQAARHTHPRLRAFYGLEGGSGETMAHEAELEGYRGSAPVQIGNGAARQRQLGNYGDLLQTAWLYVDDGNALDRETGPRLAELADFVATIWRRPDASIWELSDHRDYTQGKLAAWLALDRAVRLADSGEIPGASSGRWRAEAQTIRRYVERLCWSREAGSYVRAAGSADFDASVLLLARQNASYLADDRERVAGTIAALRSELGDGPLLYRYSGMPGKEGAFVACSFWLVEALATSGRLDEAAAVMDEVVGRASDVGLWSEQIDPASGDLLGNVPQALTHLSLVNAAFVVRDAAGGG